MLLLFSISEAIARLNQFILFYENCPLTHFNSHPHSLHPGAGPVGEMNQRPCLFFLAAIQRSIKASNRRAITIANLCSVSFFCLAVIGAKLHS